MTAGAEYSHTRHMALVQAAARSAGIKGAAFAVLSYLCSAADFKRPTVRVAKATICTRTGYHWDTVRIALRTLKAVGLIHPVAYETGGRHMATVYTLRAGKGVENAPPLEAQESTKGGGFSGQKGVENPVKRGWKIHPPSIALSKDSSGDHRSAFRAGGAGASLDVAQGGNRDAAKPLTDGERELVALFAREVTQRGFGEASRRDKARRAALAESQDLL